MYKGKWDASVGEVLMCVRDTQDRYAIAVRVQNGAFICVILSTVFSAIYLPPR